MNPKFFLTLTAVLYCTTALAYDAFIDGIFYNLSENEATVTYEKQLSTYHRQGYYGGVYNIPESVTYNGKTYSVTAIGEYAFAECLNVISITIPSSVISIGTKAFADCFQMTSITIPNSVTDIGMGAFQDCRALTSITIPDKITTIKDLTFSCCTSLTSIEIPNSVTFIGDQAFYECTGLVSVTIPNSVTNIDKNVFRGCTSLKSIEIPNSILSIREYTFLDCSSLASVIIPNSVTRIDRMAFGRCIGLTSIIIPNSVTVIDYGAFKNCSGLTSITLSNHLTTIGSNAFYGCNSLTSITIPSSVTAIGEYAFEDCNGLQDVSCYAYEVPSTDATAFIGVNIEKSTLHVPTIALEKYKNTTPWNNFGYFETTDYTLSYIVDGTIYRNDYLVVGEVITPETAPTKIGYTFSGWSEIPATMPAHDVMVVGTFTINSYKLTYIVDGEIYREEDITFNTLITSREEPIKEGYTFSGWSEIPATMPDHDVTVTGSFSINSYTLKYIVDGVDYKSSSVEYGTKLTPEAVPTKEGYSFSGWSEIPEAMPAHDVTVTGTFSINSYQLIYYVNGEVYKTSMVVYGTDITPEAELSKEGHTFSGWSEIPQTMPAHDVIIIGSFSVNKYKLTYVIDGVEYKSFDIDYGEVIIPEAEPTKEGYTFSGWDEVPQKMPAHNVIITGSFSKGQYNVTYIVDGEIYKIVCYDYDAQITAESFPKKEGFTFSGWSDIPSTMPNHDVTVTGSFTINSYTLTYLLDGQEYKTSSVEFGSALYAEAVPEKEGYTFSGWSEVPATMPAHDVTVTGTFTINSYTLTYLLDGKTYKSSSVKYGTALTPEAEPVKEGYTFSGWSEIPSAMPAHDVTVTGSFTINSYYLTFMVDGEVYDKKTVIYGSSITPPQVPEKEGYTFSWNEIPATMPAHDVTVTGSFVVNQYTITYIYKGETFQKVVLDYGSSITPPVFPLEMEGYTFVWENLPETMPAHDVTVKGSFVVNQYNITYIIDGEVYSTETVDYGSAITPPDVPDKDGCSVVWEEYPKTMPAQDLIISGSFLTSVAELNASADEQSFFTIEGKKVNKLMQGVYLVRRGNQVRKIVRR